MVVVVVEEILKRRVAHTKPLMICMALLINHDRVNHITNYIHAMLLKLKKEEEEEVGLCADTLGPRWLPLWIDWEGSVLPPISLFYFIYIYRSSSSFPLDRFPKKRNDRIRRGEREMFLIKISFARPTHTKICSATLSAWLWWRSPLI